MSNDNHTEPDHERLKALSDTLADMKAKDDAESARQAGIRKDADNMSNGVRAGAELVTCMAAGGLIGWGLDKWLETQPIFLIIFLLAGIFTGFWEVYRITQNAGAAVGFARLHQDEKTVRKPAEKD